MIFQGVTKSSAEYTSSADLIGSSGKEKSLRASRGSKMKFVFHILKLIAALVCAEAVVDPLLCATTFCANTTETLIDNGVVTVRLTSYLLMYLLSHHLF
jgi:hypothetical protein